MSTTTPAFTSEADLCTAFLQALPEGWTAYPEHGFDILLVRDADGLQIGIEAKLRLNAKVIVQAMEGSGYYHAARPGPDYRAVLVPDRCGPDFVAICAALGITVIRMRTGFVSGPDPRLPSAERDWYDHYNWFDRCPAERLKLPEYVPDVSAGVSSPVQLTDWKIRAIKIAVLLEKRGYVTRPDFKAIQINISRWIDPHAGWLVQDGKGGWIRGPHMPDFRAQHPVNYDQIAADYETWHPDLAEADT